MQGVADLAAFSLDEGIAHTAADNQVIDLGDQVLEHFEFRGDFRTADDGRERVLGVLQHAVDGANLAFHQVAEHLVVGEILGDQGRGSVSAVCRAKGVVDVAVGIGSQLLGEGFLALLDSGLGGFLFLVGGVFGQSAGFAFLFCIEAQVFEQQHFARLEGCRLGISLLAVRSELHRHAEILLDAGDNMFEREFFGGTLRPAEVRHDDQGAAACEHFFQGGDGSPDAGVVGNLELIVQRNVEIDADDGFLTAEIVGI